MKTFQFPCTGNVAIDGFPEFLKNEIKEPRRNIKLFGKELRTFLKVPYITLVNSGSSANLTAALAMKQLRPNRNKVIMAGFTFSTTISAFIIAGFDVEIIDTVENGFGMDPIELENKIDNRVACVVITHFLGFPALIKDLAHITHEYGALILQDACETMNLHAENKLIYEFGDIVTHSFYHPHHLSSYGGGAVIVNDMEMYKIIESITHWGRKCLCHVDENICSAPSGESHNFNYENIGINVEISELNACFGRFQFKTYPEQEKKRIHNYNYLYDELNELLQIKVYRVNDSVSPFVFPITFKTKAKQIEASDKFRKNGIECRNLMGGAINTHTAFKNILSSAPKCEQLSQRSIFIGIHQTISTENIKTVKFLIKKIILEI
jgi:dTDP-4-amino-4,6-dideoxygalactose transaminase